MGISGGWTGVEFTVKEVYTCVVFVASGLQCPCVVAHAIKQVSAAFKGSKTEWGRDGLTLLHVEYTLVNVAVTRFDVKLLTIESDRGLHLLPIDRYFAVGESERLTIATYLHHGADALFELGADGKVALIGNGEALILIVGLAHHDILAVPKDVVSCGGLLQTESSRCGATPHSNIGIIAFGSRPRKVLCTFVAKSLHSHFGFGFFYLTIFPMAGYRSKDVIVLGVAQWCPEMLFALIQLEGNGVERYLKRCVYIGANHNRIFGHCGDFTVFQTPINTRIIGRCSHDTFGVGGEEDIVGHREFISVLRQGIHFTRRKEKI